MKTSLKAGAALSEFAHLLGMGRPAGARADDDDKKDPDAASAEETDDDEDGDDKKDSKKSKKAKADEDDDKKDPDAAKAEEADDEDDKKDSKKSNKAKADMDDECEDEDDDYAKGQKAERARWAKVLKSPAAGGGRLAAACELLATSGLKSSAIISTLGALPVAKGGGLADRMASAEIPNVGAGSGGGSGSGGGDFAAQMKAAVAKVRPE